MSKSKKRKLSSKEESKIWFHLYDSANGLPYKGTTADYVSIPSSADIAQFRKAVKAEYDQPGYLKDIPSGNLLVFQNKQSFDKRDAAVEKGVPLDEESPVDDLGNSKDDALIVVVPSAYKKELDFKTPYPLIWFHLYDYETGLPYKETTADKVSVPVGSDITEFRKAVKAECTNKLSSIDANDLLVFLNKQTFDKRVAAVEKEEPLKSSCKLNGMGETEEDALIVAVGYKVKAVWKAEPKIVYSLDKERLFFVNREKATEQLNQIHKSKYNRASSGCGSKWVIPLADNVWGLGKSTFVSHYIAKSREQWKDSIEKGSLDDFQETLCACHTIDICFSKSALICDDMDAKMLKCLQEALNDRFEVRPDVLSNPSEDTESFLKHLVAEAGPVFIALDEIGGAFESENLNDAQRRDKFMFLCSEILSKWLIMPNVFFVLIGRGSFLCYVGLRPNGEISGSKKSPFDFSRLSIHLLRQDAIKQILKNTLFLAGEKTLQEHFELDEEQLSTVAKSLFLSTNGHPRTIVDALKKCTSYKDLIEYKDPIDFSSQPLFFDALIRYRDVVVELLKAVEDESLVNLTKTKSDAGDRELFYDIIASQVFISWEGTVESARLYTHPFVRNTLENYLRPLKEYLGFVGNVSKVSVDYPNVFEWICLKRFQEIFSAPQQPNKILPLFFQTVVFGNLNGLSFSNQTRPIPKITSGGSGLDLDKETCNPKDWHILMQKIDKLGSICLKPLAKSASSDAFLISEAELNKTSFKVTVGLAVKNYGGTELNHSNILKECDYFNRMFDETDCKKRRNFLFICCTKYHNDIFSKFNGKLFYSYVDENFPNIHEVIILDLTTPENRASFFDTGYGVIETIILKPEVELDDHIVE